MVQYSVYEWSLFVNYCKAHKVCFANRWDMMRACAEYYRQSFQVCRPRKPDKKWQYGKPIQFPILQKENIMTAATKTAKPANYTAEQETTLSTMWKAGEGVEKIASALGKTSRSVVAKLSRTFKGTEYEYKAKTYVRKDGAKVETKDTTASAIANILNLSANDADSLTKCTRVALAAVFKALADSVPASTVEEAKRVAFNEGFAAGISENDSE